MRASEALRLTRDSLVEQHKQDFDKICLIIERAARTGATLVRLSNWRLGYPLDWDVDTRNFLAELQSLGYQVDENGIYWGSA